MECRLQSQATGATCFKWSSSFKAASRRLEQRWTCWGAESERATSNVNPDDVCARVKSPSQRIPIKNPLLMSTAISHDICEQGWHSEASRAWFAAWLFTVASAPNGRYLLTGCMANLKDTVQILPYAPINTPFAQILLHSSESKLICKHVTNVATFSQTFARTRFPPYTHTHTQRALMQPKNR